MFNYFHNAIIQDSICSASNKMDYKGSLSGISLAITARLLMLHPLALNPLPDASFTGDGNICLGMSEYGKG
jgi:hypothetical protein